MDALPDDVLRDVAMCLDRKCVYSLSRVNRRARDAVCDHTFVSNWLTHRKELELAVRWGAMKVAHELQSCLIIPRYWEDAVKIVRDVAPELSILQRWAFFHVSQRHGPGAPHPVYRIIAREYAGMMQDACLRGDAKILKPLAHGLKRWCPEGHRYHWIMKEVVHVHGRPSTANKTREDVIHEDRVARCLPFLFSHGARAQEVNLIEQWSLAHNDKADILRVLLSYGAPLDYSVPAIRAFGQHERVVRVFEERRGPVHTWMCMLPSALGILTGFIVMITIVLIAVFVLIILKAFFFVVKVVLSPFKTD